MSRRRRMALVVALGVLAPWAAECSWGGFALRDYLIVVLFLGPLYGGAAVLIREIVRRTGRGWPSIALLGAAFGVLMAGPIDHSLFNLDYLDDTEYADLIRDPALTRIPGLGISAGDLLNFVGNHIVLSICAPIAIIESFAGPDGRRQPWLGRWGLGVTGVLFVLGALLIHSDAAKGYTASTGQLVVAFSVIVVLIALALAPWARLAWSRPQPNSSSGAPRAPWVAVVTAVAMASTDIVPGWGGIALHVAAILVAVVLVVRWSQRPGWSQRHVLAAVAGPLVTVAAMAYLVPNYAPASPTEAVVGDLAVTVVAATLLITAFRCLRREPQREHAPAESIANA